MTLATYPVTLTLALLSIFINRPFFACNKIRLHIQEGCCSTPHSEANPLNPFGCEVGIGWREVGGAVIPRPLGRCILVATLR